jgi:hypothetical protein
MTATAVKPQATATPAPVKALAAPAAKSPPRPKPVPLTPMRREAAGLMRKLATSVQQSHPDMNVHDHLRDAAKQTEKGNEEAAQRHLRAAMFSLTPQSLMRNGQHTDDAHQAARAAMHGIHRHLLLVKDIADVSARNQAVIRKDSGDGAAVPPPRPDPNAGYGPGANAQKPTVRQPPGDQALNAPAKADGGGSDPAVADPDAPQRPGSKQFTYTWADLAAVIELANRPKVVDLVGPKGYIHGWIFVGVPGPGQEVYHPQHGRGTVTASGSGRVQVSFDAGHSKTFPVRSDGSRGHFEQMTDDELAAEYNRSEGSRAKAVTDELDKRDQRDEDVAAQAKTQRVSALYAEQPKTEADRNRVYQSLVNEGENPEDAWAHAHSTNTEAMQKQSVIADLRAQGHKGTGFDALTRDAFKDEVRRRTISAEGATNGYMLGPAGKKAGIDPWSLFTGPESRARKYASPELKEWWDQNGRPTVADFQASLMGQKAGMKPADFYASVTQDDLAGAIELVGPGGFQHGWKPGGPTAADHDKAARLHTKAAAKAKDPAVKAMHVRRAKVHTQVARKLRSLSDPGLAYGWGDLGTLIELSAKTAALEVTPAPRGKPGGPGLYRVAGQEHTPYFQQVVKALIEKRGMPPGKAYAIAYGALRKWSKGGGGVHPEVSAAAAGSLAGEKVKVHGHANRHGRVIDLDWTAWDAGERGDASAKAHDTASATASRDAKAKIAADKLHSVADQADQKFPSASAGKDIHAAADSFSKGDAEGAHQHLQDARMKVRGASEAKGKIVGRDPIANDQNDLDSVLRTGQGQAQMMAQQQDDDAKAAAKAAKKAAKAQQHAVTWHDLDVVIEMAAAAPPASSSSTGKVQARVPAGQAGGGRFGSGTGQPDAHQQHVAHMQNVAAKQQQGQQKSAASATAGKTAAASAKAKIAAGQQSKQGLMQQAAGYRAKADALITQRKALQAQLASASGAVSSGQSGSTTSSGASTTSSGASTTASTAPAAGTTAAATTPATAASTTTTPAASTTALTAAQSAQIKVQVAQMTTQIIALQGQYAQAMAAAAKL